MSAREILEVAPGGGIPNSVPHSLLLVGLSDVLALDLATQAERLGYPCCSADASGVVGESQGHDTLARPWLIITDLDHEAWAATIAGLRCSWPEAHIAAITSTLCVFRIAAAVRQGASTVVARPASLGQITAAVEGGTTRLEAQARHMSLDRVIWEYLNQAVMEAGSISGAARRLRLDRTSLKRMLRKVPPL
jgi:ActR/RegA family two-component response regulator